MRQFWTGALAALLLSASGVWLWQLLADDAKPLPEGRPPPVAGETPLRDEPVRLPEALEEPTSSGLPPPAVYQPTREERRFNRYDRDRDGRIARIEMLSTRTNAFRKLDKDGNNLLSFEEWAVRTSDRFAGADADGNGLLTRAEFATTRPKPRPRSECRC